MMQFCETQRGPYGPINNSMDPVRNQGPCKPRHVPFPANHRNQVPPVGHFQPQLVPTRPSFYPSPQTLMPPHQSGGYSFQGHGGSASVNLVPHRLPPQGVTPPNYICCSTSLWSTWVSYGTLAHGVISLQNQSRVGHEITRSQKAPDSLLTQGVISLTKQSPVMKEEKDAFVGCEFAGLDLILHRESVLNALYEGGLPKQCKSCGLQFKCQEEHNSHMDWHVKKNRMSKKSKHIRFHNYYATSSMWLVNDAEVEAAVLLSAADKKRKCSDEEEMVVPAYEDQSKCALCTDAFIEFYSHETD